MIVPSHWKISTLANVSRHIQTHSPHPRMGESSGSLSLDSFSPFPLKPHLISLYSGSPTAPPQPGGSVNSVALGCGCSEVQGAGFYINNTYTVLASVDFELEWSNSDSMLAFSKLSI